MYIDTTNNTIQCVFFVSRCSRKQRMDDMGMTDIWKLIAVPNAINKQNVTIDQASLGHDLVLLIPSEVIQ